MTIAALVIGACSAAGASQPGIDTTQLQRVQNACAAMGLSRGDVQFDDCVTTLSRSVAAANRSAAISQARAQCSGSGLHPGSPDFANCVLDRNGVADR
jgi:hypothetical protein